MKQNREYFDSAIHFRQFLENWDETQFFHGMSMHESPLGHWAKHNFGKDAVVGKESILTPNEKLRSDICTDMTDWQTDYAELEISSGFFNKWVAIELLDETMKRRRAA